MLVYNTVGHRRTGGGGGGGGGQCSSLARSYF